ncbi:MAG: DNA polymerase I [Gallibacter sp.]|nr:DNA polymerase I [Gallibacter sp.]
MKNRLVIIDGNSLVNRAFYALKNNVMATKSGIYTNGIYGFIKMLEKIETDYAYTHIAVAFDVKAPTFRHEKYEDYKGTRKGMPDELAMQMPILKDVLTAMNIKILEKPGFEADDIIGTIAKMAEKEDDFEIIIITGDKDALQLATQATKVLITRKGVSNFNLYDENAFIEEYGYNPINIIDLKALSGDKSDNISGVAGVGDVTATKLIQKYTTIEQIYEHINEITPVGVKNKLLADREAAFNSKELATIYLEVPLEEKVADFVKKEKDNKKLIEIYRKLEFTSFLKDIDFDNVDSDEENTLNNEVDKLNFIDLAKDDIFKILDNVENIAIYEAGFLDDFQQSFFKEEKIYILVDNNIYLLNSMDLLSEIIKTKNISVWGHNLKLISKKLIEEYNVNMNIVWDTEIAEYLIDANKRDYELEKLILRRLGTNISNENIDEDIKTIFASIKVIRDIQKQELKDLGMIDLLENMELPLINVLASMEVLGCGIDTKYLEEIGKTLIEKIDILKEEIYTIAGEEFNINSPKQLGVVLFENMKIEGGKKTKTGYSTSADILEKIADKNPIVNKILEYRTYTKLQSTYIDGLIKRIDNDGRVRASFNQTVVSTGRISSSNPNMQNIPIREEIGRQIRGAFTAQGDNVLVGADYSQIELRVLAHMSEDKEFVESFNNGADIHKATAARILNIPEDDITVTERSKAKAINFGIIYGMSFFGLSEQAKIGVYEARRYIEEYFKIHSGVKAFMDNAIAFCKENGYVETLFARRRYINEINSSNHIVKKVGERLAMNTPIQGTAADIIKLAMVEVYNRLQCMKSKLILQVHDELIIEATLDELDEVKKILKESMEGVIKLRVPLIAEVSTGKNWLELK